MCVLYYFRIFSSFMVCIVRSVKIWPKRSGLFGGLWMPGGPYALHNLYNSLLRHRLNERTQWRWRCCGFVVGSKSASRLRARRRLRLLVQARSSSQSSASSFSRPASRRSPSVDLRAPNRRSQRRRLGRGAGHLHSAARWHSGHRRHRRMQHEHGHRSAVKCCSGTPDAPRGLSASTRRHQPLLASPSHRPPQIKLSGSTKTLRHRTTASTHKTLMSWRHWHHHRPSSSRSSSHHRPWRHLPSSSSSHRLRFS